jgi:hypothetical protein
VLLTIEDFEELAGPSSDVVGLLAMPGAEHIDFEPPRAGALFRAAELIEPQKRKRRNG